MAQIDKNTVESKNQLRGNGCVTFINRENKGLKILFVGNSITRHDVKESIGWFGNYGMAASSEDKDYVHLLASKVSHKHPDAAFCVCQGAEWERSHQKNEENLEMFEAAKDFGADIIVFRLIENCPGQDLNAELFIEKFNELIDYLSEKNPAKIIITSSFWKHFGDSLLEQIAKMRDCAFVYLGDLGEDESMMAIGKFEHSGVAAHPGDKGMQTIADRIYNELEKLI